MVGAIITVALYDCTCATAIYLVNYFFSLVVECIDINIIHFIGS